MSSEPEAPTGVEEQGEQQEPQAEQEQQAAESANTGKSEATEQAKPEGAPEKYEFKAPEGKQLDAETVGVHLFRGLAQFSDLMVGDGDINLSRATKIAVDAVLLDKVTNEIDEADTLVQDPVGALLTVVRLQT